MSRHAGSASDIRSAQRAGLFELQAAILRAGTAPCVGSTLWISDDPADQEYAAGHCTQCPVITECRNYGLTYPHEEGVYGGLTEKQRKHTRRRKFHD